MTTTEILQAFMKGNTKSSISEKQKSWLLSQAKKENIKTNFDGFNTSVYFADHFYQIRQCKVKASGGSYVGTKIIQGRYVIEKLFAIRFDSTGLTGVYHNTDLIHFSKEGHAFKFINPL